VKVKEGRITVQIDDDMAYATFQVPDNFAEIRPSDFAIRNLGPAWVAIVSRIKYAQEKRINDQKKKV